MKEAKEAAWLARAAERADVACDLVDASDDEDRIISVRLLGSVGTRHRQAWSERRTTDKLEGKRRLLQKLLRTPVWKD